MPYVAITPSLRELIKSERKKRKIRGDVLAKKLDRSPSYISQLERGNISSIDLKLFYSLFREIIDQPEEGFANYMNDIVKDAIIKLSDEDIKKEEWISNFELQYRQHPIRDSLIEFLQQELSHLNITPEQLIDEMNKNKDLSEEEKDRNKITFNEVNVSVNENGDKSYYILFNLSQNFLKDILDKKVTTVNYINMLGIIYNIYTLSNKNEIDAQSLAELKLKEFGFTTMKERNRKIRNTIKEKSLTKNKEDFNILDCIDDDFEKEFVKNYDEITDHFNSLRNRNIAYAVKIFSKFNKNLHVEPSITYAVLNQDFYKLQSLQHEKKVEFISKLKTLINEYDPDKTEEDILKQIE